MSHLHHYSNPFFTMPQPIPADDEEGSIFLSSAASDSFTTFFTCATPSPKSKTALPMNFKHRNSLFTSDEDEDEDDVDAFITRTLTAASKGPHLPPKRIPGTPVKKVRMSYFGNGRPWQSAVAPKVGLRNDFDFNKKRKVPGAKPFCDQLTDSEDEQESPITRREKYTTLGLGQPSPSSKAMKLLSRRSFSGSSSSSIASPTKRSIVPSSTTPRQLGPRPTLVKWRLSDSFAEEQPGRFERDFVEIEEVGSGEFGKVIKVQRKGSGDELYAIKKSKRFEGTKHR
jgi:mitosis inhibitor protein kinase SWE1